MSNTPMLRSADLLFRPPTRADALPFAEAVRESAASLSPWMPWAHANYTEAEALSWIGYCEQEWERRGSFEFGIFDGATGAYVGGCGLNQFNPVHGCCNLGYWVRQSRQGRGVATEAIRVLASYAFTELAVPRVEIVVGVGNGASLAAARKAGAHEEGIARQRLRLGERHISGHMLSLIPTGG